MVLRRIFSVFAVFGIVVVSMCVYAADGDILSFVPAMVKAQSLTNPVGVWTGTGVAASHFGDGSGEQRCDGLNITVTVATSSVAGVYLVSYSIPSFCMGTWGFSNVPAVLIGNRLVFNSARFADIGSVGNTTKMSMDLRAELVINNGSASFLLQNNGFSSSPEKAVAWVIGGVLSK